MGGTGKSAAGPSGLDTHLLSCVFPRRIFRRNSPFFSFFDRCLGKGTLTMLGE